MKAMKKDSLPFGLLRAFLHPTVLHPLNATKHIWTHVMFLPLHPAGGRQLPAGRLSGVQKTINPCLFWFCVTGCFIIRSQLEAMCLSRNPCLIWFTVRLPDRWNTSRLQPRPPVWGWLQRWSGSNRTRRTSARQDACTQQSTHTYSFCITLDPSVSYADKGSKNKQTVLWRPWLQLWSEFSN